VLHPVNDVLARSGLLGLLGEDHSWHSISQCVRAARKQTGLKGEPAPAVAADDGGEAPDGGREGGASGVERAHEDDELHPGEVEIEVLDEDDDNNGVGRS
jgi:hypothetical protein